MENVVLENIPLLKTKAGPKDSNWTERLKEEYVALIAYMESLKEDDNEWLRIESNADGTKWHGKCWFYHNYQKYEFDLQFEVI
jgi:ufm1-conjugating enzyme 1